jgi:hypothetical protein
MNATESVDNKVMVFALPVSGSEFMQNFKLKFLSPKKRLPFGAGATGYLPT